MSERPILFSGPMVCAILAGQKTVTRRVVMPQPHGDGRWSHIVASTDAKERGAWSLSVPDPNGEHFTERGRERELARVRCPHGSPSDTLWVREAAYIAPPHFGHPSDGNARDDEGRSRVVGYAASMCGDSVRCAEDYGVKKTPSIHMQRWAARITLRVIGVRVERLHAIDEADAILEGVDAVSVADVPRNAVFSRRDDFVQLWEKINGKRAPWRSNPWVWRVAFDVVEVKR